MWLIKPTKLFNIPFTTSSFFISAKIDVSTKFHLAQGIIFGAFPPMIGLFYILGKEIGDGSGTFNCVGELKCKQGFDLVDFSVFILGMTLTKLIFSIL